MGQGAAAARGGRRARPARDAARARRRRARPRRPGRAGLPRRRRGAPARRAPPSRRCASTAGKPFLLERASRAAARLGGALGAAAAGRRRRARRSVVAAAAPPDHVLRLYRTRERRSSRLAPRDAAARPRGANARAASRSRSVEAPVPELLAGVKSTSYAVTIAARQAAADAGADDALLVRRTASCSRRRRRTSGGASSGDLLTPGRSAPACSPASRARSLLELAPRLADEGALPLAELRARRRGVHDLVDPRGDAGRRARRRDDRRRPARPGGGTAAGRSLRLRSAPVSDEKIRLGGMALANGVLVHGPTAWACAIRTDDGELEGASRGASASARRRCEARSCAARRGSPRRSRSCRR